MMGLLYYIPLNLICMVALGALGLRRLVRMEKFHWLRVTILTGLLWVPTVYLILLGSPLSPLSPHSCVTMSEEPTAFTITE